MSSVFPRGERRWQGPFRFHSPPTPSRPPQRSRRAGRCIPEALGARRRIICGDIRGFDTEALKRDRGHCGFWPAVTRISAKGADPVFAALLERVPTTWAPAQGFLATARSRIAADTIGL